jgi:excisionase family DNA binding protein
VAVDKAFLTIEEVSQYPGIKASTLYAWVSEIPHYKIGHLLRFRKEDIDKWMETKRSDSSTEQISMKKRAKSKNTRKGEGMDIVRRAIDQVRGSKI